MTQPFTLGKNERLKSRKQIEKIFEEEKKFSITPYRIHYLFNEAGAETLQFGVGVSSKNFKKAVHRNKIKRLTREAWRLQKSDLVQIIKKANKHFTVFLIYTGKEIPEYKDVYVSVGKIIDRIDSIINQAI